MKTIIFLITFATIVVWIVLAIATGFAAKSRGRDGVGWFLLAILISPVLALILLIAFPSRFVGRSKICHFCQSQVAEEALVCPHCHRDIDTPEGIQAGRAERERYLTKRALVIAGVIAAVLFLPLLSSLLSPARHSTQVSSPPKDVIVESQTWEKGVNAIVDLVIANKATYDVRNVTAKCAFYSEADKEIASSFRGLPGVIRPGRWQFQKVDFGPADSQAVTVSCWISAFTKAGEASQTATTSQSKPGDYPATPKQRLTLMSWPDPPGVSHPPNPNNVTYEQLSRSPGSFIGATIALKGRVIQSSDIGDADFLMAIGVGPSEETSIAGLILCALNIIGMTFTAPLLFWTMWSR